MFKLLPQYLKNFKKEVTIGPMFKLLEAVFELIVPLVMVKIIDVGVMNKDIYYVLKMGIILILLGFTGLLAAITCQYFASVASEGVGKQLRLNMFNHINSLSHTEIDSIGTSSLITRLTNDVNQIQNAVAMLIRLVIRAPFLILGSTIMAMYLNLKLSLIFLIIIPLIAFVLYMIMSKSVPFFTTIQKRLDKISLITGENLEGARVVRAFSKEKSEQERFLEASTNLSNLSINVGKISALLNPITTLIMNISIIAILWFGSINIDLGNITQGELIAFVNYMTQISLALVVVANLVVTFNKAAASSKRINELFEIHSTITEKNSVHKSSISHSKIEFRNVSFSYNNSNEKSLNNISFKINEGETIGIIGGTGAGKSTLINLIPRFYDTTEGSVIVNGINAKDYKLKDLRCNIGIVPQKSVLFSGTIRKNMCLSNINATNEDLDKAFNIAQASEFISNLPDKYDTILSQGGKNLSGGQKQRLTIARALVNNPDILILDDSSSALDFATDAKLRQALKENTKDMTVILVSQRASTIRNADKILVLDSGNLVGIGTHETLMKTCDVYKEICLSQLTSEEALR